MHLQLVPCYPQIKTTEYPTRYTAFSRQNTLVEQANPQIIKDYEWAIYYEPYQNRIHNNTMDAILIEILYHEDDKFLLKCYASRPDEKREEYHQQQLYDSYAAAKQAVAKWISKAHAFIKIRG